MRQPGLSIVALAISAVLIGGPTIGLSSPQSSRAGEDDVVTMTECEGSGNCANWTLTGGVGMGEWRDGQKAMLSIRGVKKLGDKSVSVTIHRVDIGSTKGYVADYTGTLNDSGRMVGEFTSTSSGRPVSGGWYATPGAPLTYPESFHLCSGPHCLTYVREGNLFINRTNLPYQQNEVRTIEIRSFSRDSVNMYEYDRGSYPLTAVWTGHASPDGGDMIDGEVRITSWQGHPTNNSKSNSFRMAWGQSLEKIPGSDQEMAGGSYQGGVQPSQGMTIDQGLQAAKIASDLIGYFIRWQELHPNP